MIDRHGAFACGIGEPKLPDNAGLSMVLSFGYPAMKAFPPGKTD